MKMVKHLFEGTDSTEVKMLISQKVEENRSVIDAADDLLQRISDNDDLAVMLVKIISCFNSISNKLE